MFTNFVVIINFYMNSTYDIILLNNNNILNVYIHKSFDENRIFTFYCIYLVLEMKLESEILDCVIIIKDILYENNPKYHIILIFYQKRS